MNRCAICDVTEDDNPKAGISTVSTMNGGDEDLCEQCRQSIEEVKEDYAVADLEEELRKEQSYWDEAALSKS